MDGIAAVRAPVLAAGPSAALAADSAPTPARGDSHGTSLGRAPSVAQRARDLRRTATGEHGLRHSSALPACEPGKTSVPRYPGRRLIVTEGHAYRSGSRIRVTIAAPRG